MHLSVVDSTLRVLLNDLSKLQNEKVEAILKSGSYMVNVDNWDRRITHTIGGPNCCIDQHFMNHMLIRNRVLGDGFDDSAPQQLWSTVTLDCFLPTRAEQLLFREDLTHLVRQILFDSIPAVRTEFGFYFTNDDFQLRHKYWNKMQEKSEYVSCFETALF